MKKIATVFSLWLLGSTALYVTGDSPSSKRGDHAVDLLIVTKAGCWEVTMSPAGVPTMTPSEHTYKQVVVLGDGPSPTPLPVPTPDPTPAPLTERGKLAKAEADKITADPKRAQSAQALSAIYKAVSNQVKSDPSITLPALIAALKFGQDTVLAQSSPQATQAWVPFRNELGTQMGVLSARSAKITEYASLLDEFAAGLDASAPSKSVDPAFWQFLMQLITLILTLLKPTP